MKSRHYQNFLQPHHGWTFYYHQQIFKPFRLSISRLAMSTAPIDHAPLSIILQNFVITTQENTFQPFSEAIMAGFSKCAFPLWTLLSVKVYHLLLYKGKGVLRNPHSWNQNQSDYYQCNYLTSKPTNAILNEVIKPWKYHSWF